MTTRLNLVWTYITECARLLYWAYFKPFTFRAWLKEIHPDLKMGTNPFNLRGEFPANPRLRRYAEQSWWLSFTLPVLAVFISGMIYTLATGEELSWLPSSIFLLGWSMGLLLIRIVNTQTFQIIYAISLLIFLFWILSQYFPYIWINWLFQSWITYVPIYVLLGGVFGVVFGAQILASSFLSSLSFNFLYSLFFVTISATILMLLLFFLLFTPIKNIFDISTIFVNTTSILSVTVIFASIMSAFSTTFRMMYVEMKLPTISNSKIVAILNIVVGVIFGGFVIVEINKLEVNVISSTGVGILLSVSWILGVFRGCFWIPELWWSMVLVLGSRLSRADRFLPYLPQRFDQLIYLPLPFLDILIADAYRQNPIAAQRTLDYLLAFTNQQSLAARAMVQISIDCLYQCENLSAITVIAEELAWLPSPPPAQLGTILPRFLEISQSVRAATLATSAYRQAELLASPLTALERLQNELAFSPDARLAATFGSITHRWRQIIQQARQDWEATATYTREIPSAYIAGPTLNPETAQHRFKGREDIFARIETLALSPQPPVLLLYSGRRTGKTSALKYLPQRVGGDLVPLLVDLQGGAAATTLPRLAEYIADEMTAAARKSRNLRLPELNRRSLQEDPFIALQQWLKQIETIAPSKRFLLCLDEFERLSEVVTATGSRTPLNFLRHILQHRERWILLFSGSHTLDELADYWSDYLINTQSLRVTYLERNHAQELIQHPIPDFPDIYTPAAVERILELTRCQPYLVQLVGVVVVDMLNERLRQSATASTADLSKVTPQDVETVIPKVLATGGQYFQELWKVTLLDAEREALKFILRGELPQNASQRVLPKLVQKEVIELGKDGMYRLQVPLVQRSLSQFIDDEEEN